jgi:hypothetical protein
MDEQTIGILAQMKIKSVICCSGNRLMKTNIRHVPTFLLHLRRLVLESGCSNEVNSAGNFSDLQVLKPLSSPGRFSVTHFKFHLLDRLKHTYCGAELLSHFHSAI